MAVAILRVQTMAICMLNVPLEEWKHWFNEVNEDTENSCRVSFLVSSSFHWLQYFDFSPISEGVGHLKCWWKQQIFTFVHRKFNRKSPTPNEVLNCPTALSYNLNSGKKHSPPVLCPVFHLHLVERVELGRWEGIERRDEGAVKSIGTTICLDAYLELGFM